MLRRPAHVDDRGLAARVRDDPRDLLVRRQIRRRAERAARCSPRELVRVRSRLPRHERVAGAVGRDRATGRRCCGSRASGSARAWPGCLMAASLTAERRRPAVRLDPRREDVTLSGDGDLWLAAPVSPASCSGGNHARCADAGAAAHAAINSAPASARVSNFISCESPYYLRVASTAQNQLSTKKLRRTPRGRLSEISPRARRRRAGSGRPGTRPPARPARTAGATRRAGPARGRTCRRPPRGSSRAR